MNKYRVNVNGTTYEVEVENITEGAAQAAGGSQGASSTEAVGNPQPAPAAPAPATAGAGSGAGTPGAPAGAAATGGEPVAAPMPGNILKINAKPGAAVRKGDIIMILEAMKMENEILAPRDGVIASIDVAEGASVETGQRLCSLS